MDLEIIILSEASQTEKDKYHMISRMWNLKYDKLIYETETDSWTENRLVVAKRVGEGWAGSLGLADANYYINDG